MPPSVARNPVFLRHAANLDGIDVGPDYPPDCTPPPGNARDDDAVSSFPILVGVSKIVDVEDFAELFPVDGGHSRNLASGPVARFFSRLNAGGNFRYLLTTSAMSCCSLANCSGVSISDFSQKSRTLW